MIGSEWRKLGAGVLLAVASCLVGSGCGCDGENPRVSVYNMSAGEVDVTIRTSAAEELRFNDLPIGAASSSASIPRGTTHLVFRFQDDTTLDHDLGAQKCHDYECMVWEGGIEIDVVER